MASAKTGGVVGSSTGSAAPLPITTDATPHDQMILPPLITVPPQAMYEGGAFKDILMMAKSTFLQANSLVQVPLNSASGTVVLNLPMFSEYINDAIKLLILVHDRWMGNIKYRITLCGASTYIGAIEVGTTVTGLSSPKINDLRVIKGETLPVNNTYVWEFEVGPTVPNSGIKHHFFTHSSDSSVVSFADVANMDWSPFPHVVVLQNIPIQTNITSNVSNIYLRIETMLSADFCVSLMSLQRISAVVDLLQNSTLNKRIPRSLQHLNNVKAQQSVLNLNGLSLGQVFASPDILYMVLDGLYSSSALAPSATDQVSQKFFVDSYIAGRFSTVFSTSNPTYNGTNPDVACHAISATFPSFAENDTNLTGYFQENKDDVLSCISVCATCVDHISSYASIGFIAITTSATGHNLVFNKIGAALTNREYTTIDRSGTTSVWKDPSDILLTEDAINNLEDGNGAELQIQQLSGVAYTGDSIDLKCANVTGTAFFRDYDGTYTSLSDSSSTYAYKQGTKGWVASTSTYTVYLFPFLISSTNCRFISDFSTSQTTSTCVFGIRAEFFATFTLSDFSFIYGSYTKAPALSVYSKVPETARRLIFTRSIPGSVSSALNVDGIPTTASRKAILFPTLNSGEIVHYQITSPNNNQVLLQCVYDKDYDTHYFIPGDQSIDLYATFNSHDAQHYIITNAYRSTIGNLPGTSLSTAFLTRVVSENTHPDDKFTISRRHGPHLTRVSQRMLLTTNLFR